VSNLAEKLPEQQVATADLTLVVTQSSVGEQLRKAREKRGWKPVQVAQRLNLTERYIAAIEADDFALLPGTTFVRGYLRNYAQCVGLDSDSILCAYEQYMKASSEPVKLRKRERLKAFSTAPLMRALGGLSVLLFVLTSMYWWRSEHQTVVSPTTAQMTVVEVATVEGETKVETLDMNAPQVTNDIDPRSVGQSAGASTLSSVSTLAASESGDVLVVEFADSSWLEIRNSRGEVLFSGMKQGGEKLQLTSLTHFDIAIGNAAAVKLSYNSAPVDLSSYTRNGNAAELQLGM